VIRAVVDWETGPALAALRSWPNLARGASRAAVHETGEIMAAFIQAHAEGRPGPNIVSGNLRGGVLVDHNIGDEDGWGALTVYDDVIYSRRIEYGFYGTDALGRTYNQPPYPFWGPGFNDAAAVFPDVLNRHLGSI
jgi:hypothetical protein